MMRAQRIQEEAARGIEVRFIDMNDFVCGAVAERCRTERDGLVLYTDDNHITRALSRALAPALGERLTVALQR
ncbi:hypothetical protein D3C83_104710 [compost metagenome]